MQFFCTDVTLFAHSRQVKSQLGISEPGFAPAGIQGGRRSLFPGPEQVEGHKCGLFMINVEWRQPKPPVRRGAGVFGGSQEREDRRTQLIPTSNCTTESCACAKQQITLLMFFLIYFILYLLIYNYTVIMQMASCKCIDI